MSFRRRPSSRISVFCGPVAPNPRRSMEVLEALLPNRSFIVNPTCELSSSGMVRAGLLAISSPLITVTLAGRRRTSSGKRVAVMTTASSCAKQTETQSPARMPAVA